MPEETYKRRAPSTFAELINNVIDSMRVMQQNQGGLLRGAALQKQTGILRVLDAAYRLLLDSKLIDEKPVTALLYAAELFAARNLHSIAFDIVRLALNIFLLAEYTVVMRPYPYGCEPLMLRVDMNNTDALSSFNAVITIGSDCGEKQGVTAWSITPDVETKWIAVKPLAGSKCEKCTAIRIDEELGEKLPISSLVGINVASDDVYMSISTPQIAATISISTTVHSTLAALLSNADSINFLDFFFTVNPFIYSDNALFKVYFDFPRNIEIHLLDGIDVDSKLRGYKVLLLHNSEVSIELMMREVIGPSYNVLYVYPLPCSLLVDTRSRFYMPSCD